MIVKVNNRSELNKIEEKLSEHNVSYQVFDNSHYLLMSIEDNNLDISEFDVEVSNSDYDYLFVNKEVISKCTEVEVKGQTFVQDGKFNIIAGPCSIERKSSLIEMGEALKLLNLKLLRGGAYKPRTSPYSFLGLKDEGLDIMQEVVSELDLISVSEIMDSSLIDSFDVKVDIFQIGARNMQNFALLEAISKSNKPVILKRGFSNTIEEWLNAAEYIVKGGNKNVILCERGIRTFEPMTRNTLDLSVIPIVKRLSNLPIIVDPSHATGDADLVLTMAKAAYVAGADGLMIEISDDVKNAISDKDQALTIDQFNELIGQLKMLEQVVKREIV